jgi:hypothetical protein
MVLVSLAPAERKAGMAREAMGVAEQGGRDGAGEDEEARYPKKDDRSEPSVDRICRSDGPYDPRDG